MKSLCSSLRERTSAAFMLVRATMRRVVLTLRAIVLRRRFHLLQVLFQFADSSGIHLRALFGISNESIKVIYKRIIRGVWQDGTWSFHHIDNSCAYTGINCVFVHNVFYIIQAVRICFQCSWSGRKTLAELVKEIKWTRAGANHWIQLFTVVIQKLTLSTSATSFGTVSTSCRTWAALSFTVSESWIWAKISFLQNIVSQVFMLLQDYQKFVRHTQCCRERIG